jgi:hypothetical protein
MTRVLLAVYTSKKRKLKKLAGGKRERPSNALVVFFGEKRVKEFE